MGESIEGVREGARTVKEAMAARGRDPEQLRVQGPLPLVRNEDGTFDLAKSMEHVPVLVDAGATAIHLPLHMFAKTMEDAPGVLADIKRRYDASF
jgi:predicted aspartyl protease